MIQQLSSLFSKKVSNFICSTYENALIENLSTHKDKEKNETYNSYLLKNLEKSNWLDIRQQFPVLEKDLLFQKEKVQQLYLEIIRAFQKDKIQLLKKGVIQGENTYIQNINLREGDFHNGKSTSIVELSNNQKLIFKPTNGAISNSYFNFLNWVNTYLPLGNYQHNLLNKKEFHWQEFVNYNNCSTENELITYYRRAGYMLFILYLLNSTDFHAENIIANNSSLVLIDHETVIQPRLSDRLKKYFKQINIGEKGDVVLEGDTVLDSFLLSRKGVNNSFSEGMCGLGYSKKTYSSGHIKVGVNRFTKNWKMVTKPIKVELTKKNIPKLNNKKVFIDDYIEECITGFEESYNFFLTHKEFLLSKESPIQHFKNVPVRYLWRPTRVYIKILEYMRLPKNLKDEKKYEQKIRNYLAVAYKNVPKDSNLWFIYEHEVAQMLRGDIPYFEINTSSRDLNTEYGVIENLFELSCMENLERKLNKLSVKDLEFQKNLIVKNV